MTPRHQRSFFLHGGTHASTSCRQWQWPIAMALLAWPAAAPPRSASGARIGAGRDAVLRPSDRLGGVSPHVVRGGSRARHPAHARARRTGAGRGAAGVRRRRAVRVEGRQGPVVRGVRDGEHDRRQPPARRRRLDDGRRHLLAATRKNVLKLAEIHRTGDRHPRRSRRSIRSSSRCAAASRCSMRRSSSGCSSSTSYLASRGEIEEES